MLACRLLANAYSVHIAHLTSGMRIGAAAAEKLDLFPVRARLGLHMQDMPACLPYPNPCLTLPPVRARLGATHAGLKPHGKWSPHVPTVHEGMAFRSRQEALLTGAAVWEAWVSTNAAFTLQPRMRGPPRGQPAQRVPGFPCHQHTARCPER